MTRPKQEQEVWDHVDDKQIAWATIRDKLGHELPAFWIRTYHEKSMTFRNPKTGDHLKITLDGHVHHDRRIGNGEYKSAKYGPISAEAATAKVLELMA